jgi:hypothetical protein
VAVFVAAVALSGRAPDTWITRIVNALAAALSAVAAVACVVLATASRATIEAASTAALYAGASGSAMAIDWSLAHLDEPAADNWPWSIGAVGICTIALAANEWLWGWALAAVWFVFGAVLGFGLAQLFATKLWVVVASTVLVGALFAGAVRTSAGTQAVGGLEVGLVLGPVGFVAVMMFVTAVVEQRRGSLPFPLLPELLLVGVLLGLLDEVWAGEEWTEVQLSALTLLMASMFALSAIRGVE